eukprot:12431492-Karenia_brevis.AAC.2
MSGLIDSTPSSNRSSSKTSANSWRPACHQDSVTGLRSLSAAATAFGARRAGERAKEREAESGREIWSLSHRGGRGLDLHTRCRSQIALIRSCKGGQWQRVAASVISFSAAISACEKGGQWQRVAAYVISLQCSHLGLRQGTGSVRRLLASMGGQWQRVAAHVLSFSAAISACEKGGQWQRVARQRVAAYVISFSAAVSACEKGGQNAWQRVAAYVISFMIMQPSQLARRQWQRAALLLASCNGWAVAACGGVCDQLLNQCSHLSLREAVAACGACENGGPWWLVASLLGVSSQSDQLQCSHLSVGEGCAVAACGAICYI